MGAVEAGRIRAKFRYQNEMIHAGVGGIAGGQLPMGWRERRN